jgi:hypothetical protein
LTFGVPFISAEEWQQADGILSHSNNGGQLRLRLDHLQQFVLDSLLLHQDANSMRLVKRSQAPIYDNYLEGLARLLEEPLKELAHQMD